MSVYTKIIMIKWRKKTVYTYSYDDDVVVVDDEAIERGMGGGFWVSIKW